MCAEGLLHFCNYLDNIPKNPIFAFFYFLQTFIAYLILLLCFFEVILISDLNNDNRFSKNEKLNNIFIFGISIFILCILIIVVDKINRKHKQENQKKMF